MSTLKVARNPNKIIGRKDVHWPVLWHRMENFNVRYHRLIRLLHCGWYGVVRKCEIRPSDMMSMGMPKRAILSGWQGLSNYWCHHV